MKLLLIRNRIFHEVSPGVPKHVDSKTVLKDVDGSPVSKTMKVSGELGILQSSVAFNLYKIRKPIQNYTILLHVTKIFLIFFLFTQVITCVLYGRNYL